MQRKIHKETRTVQTVMAKHTQEKGLFFNIHDHRMYN